MFGIPQGRMGVGPSLPRPFNDWDVEEVERFLHFIHNKKIRPFQEDRLLLKETMTDGFQLDTCTVS